VGARLGRGRGAVEAGVVHLVRSVTCNLATSRCRHAVRQCPTLHPLASSKVKYLHMCFVLLCGAQACAYLRLARCQYCWLRRRPPLHDMRAPSRMSMTSGTAYLVACRNPVEQFQWYAYLHLDLFRAADL
jgi:hypothetical protein